MERIAYIQEGKDRQPYSANGALAARGFELLGYSVRTFASEELGSLPLNPETIVVGGMGTVRAALAQVSGREPAHISVPAILHPYLGRECWRSTLGKIRAEGRFPIFLKPYDEAKIFNGQVINNVADLDCLLAPRENFPDIDESFAVLAQETVSFLSEWRVFVVRQVVVGVSFYQGNPLNFPSPEFIRLTVGAYHQAPAGYSADFGITDDGRTLLIEINDGYSLGHGGLTANLYADLLRARWRELTDA